MCVYKCQYIQCVTLERLVDRHIRNDVLERNPLHINQHAYQSGKSTDTALNSVVSNIEKALQTQEIEMGAFLDIEGAFDRTSFEAISSTLLTSDMGFHLFFERWIASMLSSRCNIWGRPCRSRVSRAPQGGVSSSLLWNLTVDELL